MPAGAWARLSGRAGPKASPAAQQRVNTRIQPDDAGTKRDDAVTKRHDAETKRDDGGMESGVAGAWRVLDYHLSHLMQKPLPLARMYRAAADRG